MDTQGTIPVFYGDFGLLVDCLLAEMSETERDDFQEAAHMLALLPDRTVHALLALYCSGREQFNLTPRWVS